jgi:hypothetical protein
MIRIAVIPLFGINYKLIIYNLNKYFKIYQSTISLEEITFFKSSPLTFNFCYPVLNIINNLLINIAKSIYHWIQKYKLYYYKFLINFRG